MSKHKNWNSKYVEYFSTLIGQLGWGTRPSRPDISFKKSELSSIVTLATIDNLMRVMKILHRIKLESLQMKFNGLGNLGNVKIIVYNDSSFDNFYYGRSDGGFTSFLAYSFGDYQQ